MTLTSAVRSLAAALVLGAVVSGCGDGGTTGSGTPPAGQRPVAVDGEGTASCASVLDFAGHRYMGHGELVRDPATTGRSEKGTALGCDDGSGAEPDRAVTVEELADVPMDRAVLAEGTLFVRADLPFPEQVRIWFRQPSCVTAGAFELRGTWLSVRGPREVRFDGDLRPPYHLTMHVGTGPEEYVGTTVTVRATSDTDPSLGPKDVKTSLWEGGEVTAEVTCQDGRFVAGALTSTPG